MMPPRPRADTAQDNTAPDPFEGVAPASLRVHFQTHGCTTNLGDTRIMQGILESHGHQIVASPDEADVLVLNTCTVVQTTDQRMEHILSMWSGQGKRIVAAGCMAAAQQERLKEAAPEAVLLSPRYLHHIEDVVTGRAHEPHYAAKAGLPRKHGATDAIIPLAEGCLFSCTYCLTKKARGDQTSYPADALVADIREAITQGAIEIKLTSQDTSGYGMDRGTDLAQLIDRITAIGGEYRVRAGMMHPRTAHRILDPLLDAMDHPNVYKFLHLPIQTGSRRILKAMKRGHRMEEFWDVVHAFRARFPRSVVSTDLIVGFPGETTSEHEETLELLRELEAEHVNVTRYSARPGTPAAEAPARIPTETAKARSREATRCVMEIWERKKPQRIAETLDVFIVEDGKKPGSVLGRGPGYEPVVIRASQQEVPLGSRLEARITHAETTYFIAEPVSPARLVAKVRARSDPPRRLPPLRVL